MKKYKITIFIVSGILLILGFFYFFHLCSSVRNDTCFPISYSASVWEPLFLFLISLFISSFFTFFISDNIFKKWFKFTVFWMIATIIFVILAPEHDYRFFSGPTKESVSIWMGSLFVIISLIIFSFLTYKERKK